MSKELLQEMVEAVVAGDTQTAKDLFSKYVTEATRARLTEAPGDEKVDHRSSPMHQRYVDAQGNPVNRRGNSGILPPTPYTILTFTQLHTGEGGDAYVDRKDFTSVTQFRRWEYSPQFAEGQPITLQELQGGKFQEYLEGMAAGNAEVEAEGQAQFKEFVAQASQLQGGQFVLWSVEYDFSISCVAGIELARLSPSFK